MKPKLIVILVAVAVALIIAGSAAAFKNEPPGFRGIKWGTPIAAVKDEMTLYQVDVDSPKDDAAETLPSDDSTMDKARGYSHLATYHRKDDPLKIGRADVRSITYGFYKGRFFRVTVDYMELWNYDALQETFFDLYGPGLERKGEFRSWWWSGRNLTVGLKYEMFKRGGTATWIYNPIQQQKDKDFLNEGWTGGEGF